MERPNPKRTKRLQTLTRALLAICLLGGFYGIYALARPVYWHVVGSSNRIAGPVVDSRKQLYEELEKTGGQGAGSGIARQGARPKWAIVDILFFPAPQPSSTSSR